MPVEDVRKRVAELERELALLRPLLAHAPKAASKPAKVPAPLGPLPEPAVVETRVRRRSPQREALVAVAREHPDGVTPAEVARALDKPAGTVQASMWRMAKSGLLVSAGRGLYKLPPENQTSEGILARRKALADIQPTLEGSEGEAMEP